MTTPASDHGGCPVNDPARSADDVLLRASIEAHMIEVFRKALMKAHHQDWDMETISEAAHVCAEAWCNSFGRTERTDAR